MGEVDNKYPPLPKYQILETKVAMDNSSCVNLGEKVHNIVAVSRISECQRRPSRDFVDSDSVDKLEENTAHFGVDSESHMIETCLVEFN